MFKNKKSWLSIAAAMALGSSVVTAGYLPLTTTTQDDTWVMFGVNGFHSDGATEGQVFEDGAWSIVDDSVRNVAIDDTVDELYGSDGVNNQEDGMFVGGGVHEILGKVKIIPDGGISYVQVRVDTADVAFNETDPERTIYIADDDDNVIFAFTYRGALEGKRLEYTTTQNTESPQVRYIELRSEYSYSNAVVGTLTTTLDDAAIEGTNIADIEDVVDYNISNNPVNSLAYTTADDQDTAADFAPDNNATTQLYRYDAALSQWELYDSDTEGSNFTALTKGKGYWGKIDTDGLATKAGLVLAKSATISRTDYLASGLASDAWNLISFDGQNPNIRVATTGIVGTTADGSTFDLYDASGVFSVTLDVNGTTEAARAASINEGIVAAKAADKLPRTMNVTALASGTDTLLISNEKFSVDGTAGGYNPTTTLAGETLIDATTTTQYAQGDQSKYGEYALVIEPMTGNADARFEIMPADSEGSSLPAATLVQSDLGLTGLPAAYTDYNITAGGKNLVMIVADEPFVIRDHTFTRVFEYAGGVDVGTNGSLSLLQVGGSTGTTLTTGTEDGNESINDYVADLNTDLNGDDVYAVTAGTDKVVIRTSEPDSNAFYVVETASDNLTPFMGTISDDNASGAVKNVYSLGAFVKPSSLVTENTTLLSFNEDANTSFPIGTDLNISFQNGGVVSTATFTAASDYNLSSTSTDVDDFFDDLIASLETFFRDEGIIGSVEHNSTADDLNSTVITFVTDSITDVTGVVTSTGTGIGAFDTNTTTGVTVNIGNGDITTDLKYNSVYTPNYVLNGPLYTLKSLGFTPRGLVTGIMNLDSTSANQGVVKWDSVDLTRPASEWLESQEYNLFGVDSKAGYWAYLETDTNPITLTVSQEEDEEPRMTALGYSQHFDDPATATDGRMISTSFNSFSGTVNVTIPELQNYTDRTAIRVQAQYAGTDIELTSQSATDFTGRIDYTELLNKPTSTNDVSFTIADGTGYRATWPAADERGVIIDTTKPDTPTLVFSGPTVSMSSSADVVNYFIYSEAAATAPATTKVQPLLNATPFKKVPAAEAAAFNICSEINYGTGRDLHIFAVDGGGERNTGNASDAVYIRNYTSLLKGATLLQNTNDGTISTTSTGVEYSAACVEGDVSPHKGVQLSAISDLVVTKVSFAAKEAAPLAVPNFVHLENSNGEIVRINYDDIYEGDIIHVQIGDELYQYTLPAALPTTIGEGSAIDLETSADATRLPDQSL